MDKIKIDKLLKNILVASERAQILIERAQHAAEEYRHNPEGYLAKKKAVVSLALVDGYRTCLQDIIKDLP